MEGRQSWQGDAGLFGDLELFDRAVEKQFLAPQGRVALCRSQLTRKPIGSPYLR